MKKRTILLALLALLWFLSALRGLESGRDAQGKQQLEDTLRRTAVTCYASEGVYPPNVDYMKGRYGLQYDESKYLIRYEIFASNLMPDITVLEVTP